MIDGHSRGTAHSRDEATADGFALTARQDFGRLATLDHAHTRYMDGIGFRIDECLCRLRGLRRDIDASVVALRDVQLGMGLATAQFAGLVADRRAPGEIAECLQRMRCLGTVVAKASKDLSRAELKMRLEFALLDSLETRRAAIDTHPIPWRWMRHTPQ